VQLFIMRLCYSRKIFVMAFPLNARKPSLPGMWRPFIISAGAAAAHLRQSDNGSQRILEGKNRQEQESFVAFRSHYLFESATARPTRAMRKAGGARRRLCAAQLSDAHPRSRVVCSTEQLVVGGLSG